MKTVARLAVLALASLAGACAPAQSNTAPPVKSNAPTTATRVNIVIKTEGRELTATLDDNPTARAFAQLLPLDLSLEGPLVVLELGEPRRPRAAVEVGDTEPVVVPEGARPSWFGVPMTLKSGDRNAFGDALEKRGIRHRPFFAGNITLNYLQAAQFDGTTFSAPPAIPRRGCPTRAAPRPSAIASTS